MTSLRVTAPGYISVVQEVEVKGDAIVFVQFRLPSVSAVLSELLVGVQGDEPTGTALTAADLLAMEVPSARVTSGAIGRTDYAFRLRAAASSLTLRGEPIILLDGVMISQAGETALDALSQIPASEVLEIEVLRGAAASARYPLAANGVVLVKTRGGGGR